MEQEAIRFARQTYGGMALHDESEQLANILNISRDSLASEAQRILNQAMIFADMPARLAMKAIGAAKQRELQAILKSARSGDSGLAESIIQQSKSWLSALGGLSALENAWTSQGATLSDGFAEFAERARAQMITADMEITALFRDDSVKALWKKYADASAFATRTRTEDNTDEVGQDAAEEVASLVEAETLRFAIQSLSDTARSLHALATTPDSKGQAERANIIAARGVVIAYIALFVAILTMIMTPFWDAYVKECLLKGDLKCKTLFEGAGSEKQTAKDDAAFDLYRSARRITARNLTLRLNAKGLSPAVANIGTGALVIVLREGDDWTLIEADVSGSKRAGWVYTRYLIKI